VGEKDCYSDRKNTDAITTSVSSRNFTRILPGMNILFMDKDMSVEGKLEQEWVQ
jgi:exoribonuclease II